MRHLSMLLFLCSFAVALANAQTPTCDSFQNKVTIQLHSGGVANPDPACVGKAGLVVWCSDEDDFATDFTDSPFESNNKHIAGKKGDCTKPEKVKACSDSGSGPCQYYYNHTVGAAPGGDPTIIVQR